MDTIYIGNYYCNGFIINNTGTKKLNDKFHF